jgi:hypothetical protein
MKWLNWFLNLFLGLILSMYRTNIVNTLGLLQTLAAYYFGSSVPGLRAG